MTSTGIRRAVACGLVTSSLLLSGTATIAAPQLRLVFGLERFTRTSGDPNVFRRTFSVPNHVVAPYVMTIRNGQADGRGRVAVENSAAGTVVLNGVVVAGPADFSAKVGQIERTVTLSSSNVLEVTLAGAPDGFITIGITGVINVADFARARSGHAATVLNDGAVLVTGGDGPTGPESLAERFDPASLTFAAAAPLQVARSQHSASVLADGRHLVAAGRDAGGTLAATELFEPASAHFSSRPAGLQVPRFGHTSTMLLDGRALIIGGRSAGIEDSAERFDAQPTVLFRPPYDAAAGTFALLSHTLQQARWRHTATLLPDGRVLVLGGRSDVGFLASAEIFDPATNQFAAVASMPEPRAGHTATLLPGGRVLVLGGQNSFGYLNGAVVFDVGTQTFTASSATLILARSNHSATLLPYGEILIAGGEAGAGPLTHTEMFPPAASDGTRPSVSAALPAHGATHVDLSQVIGIRFSEPINVTTLHTGSVSLRGSGPVDASIAASENGLLLFVMPKQKLAAATRHVLTLTPAITDTSGSALDPVSIEFTTVAAPAIAAVTPAEGPIGTAVTILGNGFDAQPQLNVVTFGTTAGLVVSATATQIETIAPPGLAAGGVTLSVATRGGTATTAFLVENPRPIVTGISPQSIRAGSGPFVLSLTGTGFTATSWVTLGSAVLAPVLQTDSRLDVQIPAALVAALGTRTVVVYNAAPGGGPSNGVPFTVDGIAITSVTPASGPVGTTVIISGAGFDPVTANNTVRFNGTPAVVSNASASVLEVIVPVGATSGPIAVTTSAGEAITPPFTVTNGARLLISRSPDQRAYSPGQPVTIHTLLVDALGQTVAGAGVELVSAPAATSRVGNTFMYQTVGSYTITATVNAASAGAQAITASTLITVDADRATITCVAPFDGAFVNQAPGPVSFSGSVNTQHGIGVVTVNGSPMAVDAAGAFSTVVNAARGINFVDLAMTDGSGKGTRRTCTFMLSESWIAEGQFLPGAVSAAFTQAAIDDGDRTGAVNSLGDVLALVTNGSDLRDQLHATLQSMNPLKPASCDLPLLFGLCGMTSRLTYISSNLPGPNTASLQLVDGRLVARMRFEDPTLRLRVDGHVAGIRYDTTGTVRFDYIAQELEFDLSVDTAGQLKTSLRPESVSVTVGSMSTSFDGIEGWLLNNIIIPLSQGVLRSTVRMVVTEFGSGTFGGVIKTLVGGLDVTTLGGVFEVPRLDGSSAIAIRAARRNSSFDTNATRALAGMGLRFQSAAAHARSSLGVPMPPDAVLLDPVTHGQSTAHATHASLFGQSLHALWRAGYFDVVLTSAGLNGVVPVEGTLSVTTALPPTMTLRADGRIEMALGAMNMRIDHPGLAAQAVDASVGARMSCSPQLNGAALALDNCTTDELHLSTTDTLDDATITTVRQMVSDVLRSIAERAAEQAVPALPVTGFRVAESLAVYGVTPGATLGVVNPTIGTAGTHLLVRGGFGIR